MRNIKYLLFITSIALSLGACDQNDTEGTIYNAANTEVSFNKKAESYTFGTNDPQEYEVTVLRANANGTASIPVTKEEKSGLFTVPASADFADGSYETTIKVSFDRNQLAVGEVYPIKIGIPENPIQGKINVMTLSVTRDYKWDLYASGTYSSGLFSPWPQEMYKAEGFSKYKFPDLYNAGYDYIFTVAEDGTISLPGGLNSNGLYDFVTGYEHPTYGMISIYLDPDPNYSSFNESVRTVALSHYYYVSAGNFGWKDDSFTW